MSGLPLAQPDCLFEHCTKHRREIARRGVDDPEHLRGGGLLLQRLAEFRKEPRVLDRDDRLVGEGAYQFDLALGERLDPMAAERNHPDGFALAQYRYPKTAHASP